MGALPMQVRIGRIHIWRELSNVTFLPLVAFWLTGWFNLVTATRDPWDQVSNLGIFLLVTFLTYAIFRLLDSWKASGIVQITTGMLFFILTIWLGENLLLYHRVVFNLPRMIEDLWSSFSGLISLSKEFWAIIAVGMIWVWILLFMRKPITQDRIFNRMMFGLGMMLILIILTDQEDLTILMVGLILYLFLSLFSLSMARIADFNLIRGGKRLHFDPKLISGLAGISSMFAILAGGLSISLSHVLISLILALTNGFMIIVRFFVEQVVMPIVNLLAYLLKVLIGLFYKPATEFKIPEVDLEAPQFIGIPNPVEIEDSTASVLRTAQPYILASVLFLFITVVTLLLILRRNHERVRAVEEGTEEGITGGVWNQITTTFAQQIRSVYNRSIARLNPKKAVGLARAAHIRWIYHQLENLAARKGYPRPLASTPAEYERLLVEPWPQCEMELRIITGAYQSVRYGELPESQDEVLRTRNAWENIQKKVRRHSIKAVSQKP